MEYTAHITYNIDQKKKTASYEGIFLRDENNELRKKLKTFWLLDILRLTIISKFASKMWYTSDFVQYSAYEERHSKVYSFLRKHRLAI